MGSVSRKCFQFMTWQKFKASLCFQLAFVSKSCNDEKATKIYLKIARPTNGGARCFSMYAASRVVQHLTFCTSFCVQFCWQWKQLFWSI